ncbi:MAG: adenosine kinase [Bacteroidales bacterium]|jgi:sugar/nucleoside kinase (ribokinase family)|nr:adenosine kinase [Bacteroidales bacterium]
MKNKILGIGNALVDVIIPIDNENFITQLGLKKGGMKMIDQETKRNIHTMLKDYAKTIATGGSTANTIHGIARLGTTAGYIGKISDDEFGHFFRQDMLDSHIIPHLIISKDTDTGIATTLMTQEGERTFATCLGAAATMLPADIIPSLFDTYSHVHVEGYLVFNHDLILHVCQLAKTRGLTISMDMASYNVVEANLDFMQYLLKNYVDIIFANEEEAKAFTGKEEYEALSLLSNDCATSIVKLGARGSIVKHGNSITDIPAVSAHAIDTNGAGDIYASGFLFGLMNNMPIDRCGYIASLLSAKLVETTGAKLSENQWKQVLTKLSNEQ